MVICESCKGSGVVKGAKGNGAADNFGNKTQSQGSHSSGNVSQCMSCRGKGYYA